MLECVGHDGARLDAFTITSLPVTCDSVKRMGRRGLGIGERGEVDIAPQKRDADGKWKRATHPRSAERWRARCYYRGADGVKGELSRFGTTRREAEAALEAAFAEKASAHVEMTAGMPLVEAGRLWLAQIARPDARLSERTVTDYGRTFARYVEKDGSSLLGLTLGEANDPQRLRRFLQSVADRHGTGAARATRSVLMGVLTLALENGVIATNALRQVRHVQAQETLPARRKCADPRDTTRALTRAERDAVIDYADALASEEKQAPQTRRKRRATADLLAFMAGTGVRIAEARALRWDDVKMDKATADVRGTKSKSAERRLTLPAWLVERLRLRAEETGATGYVFASPHHVETVGDRPWDQSNCAKAVASVLEGAGFGWATPHTLRRTVATLLHEAGVPLATIADQLGHADASMTARVYLGRDPFGERPSVAQHL